MSVARGVSTYIPFLAFFDRQKSNILYLNILYPTITFQIEHNYDSSVNTASNFTDYNLRVRGIKRIDLE